MREVTVPYRIWRRNEPTVSPLKAGARLPHLQAMLNGDGEEKAAGLRPREVGGPCAKCGGENGAKRARLVRLCVLYGRGGPPPPFFISVHSKGG